MSAIDLKKAWEAAVIPPEGWQGNLYFYNRLGQKIRYGHAPALGEKKGTIVLTHGYGEHIDLYYETIKTYQKMGYEVWGMDWQGHGLSERDDPANPLRPSASGMMRHVRDLDFFVNNLVRTRHDPKTPLVMSTHSMGGHIGLLYLKKYPGVFDAAVMSAPMFDIYRLGLGNWARPFVKGIFNAASALGFRDTHVPSYDELTSVFGKVSKRMANVFKHPMTLRGEFRELVRDLRPDARLGRPTFGWIAAAYKTIDATMKEDFLKSIKTPVLIGSAENEDLVDNDALKRAAELMPHATNVKIAGSGHGLWFGDNGPFESWWKHISGFLAKISPQNPHERENSDTIRSIIAGRDIEKKLRGRTACVPRGPACTCNVPPPEFPNGPGPA